MLYLNSFSSQAFVCCTVWVFFPSIEWFFFRQCMCTWICDYGGVLYPIHIKISIELFLTHFNFYAFHSHIYIMESVSCAMVFLLLKKFCNIFKFSFIFCKFLQPPVPGVWCKCGGEGITRKIQCSLHYVWHIQHFMRYYPCCFCEDFILCPFYTRVLMQMTASLIIAGMDLFLSSAMGMKRQFW